VAVPSTVGPSPLDQLSPVSVACQVKDGPSAASSRRRRFMSAATKSIEGAEKAPAEAVQAVLKALPKAGKPHTLQEGFELTIPLYRTEETKGRRPFQVTDSNMAETVNLLVEYGGVDASAKNDPKAFYTRDFLPKAASN